MRKVARQYKPDSLYWAKALQLIWRSNPGIGHPYMKSSELQTLDYMTATRIVAPAMAARRHTSFGAHLAQV